MSHPTHPADVYTGQLTPPDEVDVFGAHVGMTLATLQQLRFVRAYLEDLSGRSVSLLDALTFCIAQMHHEAVQMCRRRGTLPEQERGGKK